MQHTATFTMYQHGKYSDDDFIIKYDSTYVIVGIDMEKMATEFCHLNTHLKISFS